MNLFLHCGRLTAGLALLTLSALMAADAWAAPPTDKAPLKVIEDFQGTLISVMKNAGKLGYQGRYRKLAPVVKQTHDLKAIVRIAVGRYWQKLSDQERTQLVDNFTELSIATYAARFDGYSGEQFKPPHIRKQEGQRALVTSDFIKSDGGKIVFTYQLHKSDGKWLIVNIITNGVSDLAMKRAEYTSIISSDGFKALISKLKEKIQQYRHEATS